MLNDQLLEMCGKNFIIARNKMMIFLKYISIKFIFWLFLQDDP